MLGAAAGEAAQDLLGLGGAQALIVLVDSTGARFGPLSSSPAAGRYRRAEPMFFGLGMSLKSSMWAKAKPTMDAPCVGVLPVDLYAGAVPQPAAGTMWSIRKIEFDEYDKFGR